MYFKYVKHNDKNNFVKHSKGSIFVFVYKIYFNDNLFSFCILTWITEYHWPKSCLMMFLPTS